MGAEKSLTRDNVRLTPVLLYMYWSYLTSMAASGSRYTIATTKANRKSRMVNVAPAAKDIDPGMRIGRLIGSF